jgi:membrane protease YdiL (CAAX protease family)
LNLPSQLESTEAREPASTRSTPAWVSSVVLMSVLILLWFLVIQRFGEGNVYAVLGPYACIATVLASMLDLHALRDWLKPHRNAIGIGVLVGIGMTVLTYPIFQLARMVMPDLDTMVKGLYIGARSTTLAKALAWVSAIAIAEEVLFRGVWPHVLSRHVSERHAYGISLVTYTLAQLGTGSIIVSLMALVCGSVWTVQRLYTRSLLSTIVAHLIWTPIVILLYPVT